MGVREVLMRNALLIAVSLLAGAAPLSAQQEVNPQANAQLGALRQAQPANPYAKLFATREALNTALQQQRGTPAPKSRVICGMTVIEVGPESDPKMGVTPPKDQQARYTIRAVDPPICSSK
jgi:hypothetical protein